MTRRRGASRLASAVLRRLVVASLLFVVAGFALFTGHVMNLAPPREMPRADAIIVLTGGQDRLKPAFRLLAEGAGEKLLVSGVNLSTRKADLAQGSGIDDAMLACCVDLDHKALDTIGNAEQSARWLRDNGYASAILVTSNYHMPRAQRELQRLAGSARIVAYPLAASEPDALRWLSKPGTLRVLAIEYGKLCLAILRTLVAPPPHTAALARL
ncbi:MAG: YdcF family protein [Rhizobiaceae bacterium]|nr:YdcF family protein [Rhizobiaceae bacterium]